MRRRDDNTVDQACAGDAPRTFQAESASPWLEWFAVVAEAGSFQKVPAYAGPAPRPRPDQPQVLALWRRLATNPPPWLNTEPAAAMHVLQQAGPLVPDRSRWEESIVECLPLSGDASAALAAAWLRALPAPSAGSHLESRWPTASLPDTNDKRVSWAYDWLSCLRPGQESTARWPTAWPSISFLYLDRVLALDDYLERSAVPPDCHWRLAWRQNLNADLALQAFSEPEAVLVARTLKSAVSIQDQPIYRKGDRRAVRFAGHKSFPPVPAWDAPGWMGLPELILARLAERVASKKGFADMDMQACSNAVVNACTLRVAAGRPRAEWLLPAGAARFKNMLVSGSDATRDAVTAFMQHIELALSAAAAPPRAARARRSGGM